MEPTAPEKRRQALARFVEGLESLSAPRPLDDPPFPYKACPLIEEVAWRTPALVADQLVESELQELTNTLNEWRGALRRWYVWLDVLEGLTDDEAWDLQWEFVESIAFQCLFYPSATRDRFTFVATNALHQVRMSADSSYPDRLVSDPKPGKEDKQRFLSRKESEAQLEQIASTLDGGSAFTAALRLIDEDDYLELTRNFRNLASHAIAPRLTVGYTNMVVRRVVPATTFVKQPNGTYKDELVPGKQQVSYGYGGTEPLQIRTVFEANLAEFEKASNCFNAYVNVLNRALSTLPRR
ncbi:hypothetical protein BLA39750_00863 [Burkholderia lata]|uniref:Uncharacterized protein n=1 Tax=Burkholderia lata (strain ATCC 17760 / DSM 23089 / LMG 22485 / NCIMB 9086 / R18194 / 383) TaxID=482957 RepID=A0A6P2V439_BURL3|nr:hypothetical protein [Burkholderia lata]VWC75857.1 hypothetical protein BLA39750_00863 [Burkholderia lata]